MLSTIKPASVSFSQLQARNPDVRLAARKALPSNQPSRFDIEGTIALAQSGDEEVRAQATDILGQIFSTWPDFSEEIFSSLMAGLGDVSTKVSGTAAKAILNKILSTSFASAEIIRSVMQPFAE